MKEAILRRRTIGALGLATALTATMAVAQETDRVLAPNPENAGILKSLQQQIGGGRGDIDTPGTSAFIIARDPARAIRRGRQLFQRKFQVAQGLGPRTGDGAGNIAADGSIGAGLADSCAACHGRPKGSAGFGGDVFTRPDSRDSVHLFGLGIQEQLADEITQDLRGILAQAEEDFANGTGGGGGLSATQQRVLGFSNVAGDWSVVTTGSIAQQGGAMAVTPSPSSSWTEINSIPLAPFSNVATTLQMDVQTPSSGFWGEAVVIIISPSRAMWWNELGRVQLPPLTPGQLNTISFPIPGSMRTALQTGASDITIKVVLNAPSLGGPYLVDNLRLTTGGGAGGPVTANLVSKGISYGSVTVSQNGVDLSNVQGVDEDLRVRPFFWQGGTVSIREFAVGAFNAEMGLESADQDLIAVANGTAVVTPSGMVLDPAVDVLEAPPVMSETEDSDGDGVTNEIPTSLVDFMEFYLLNYFKPGHYEETSESILGRATFNQIGCNNCHRANLTIDSDRRVADVETVYDPVNGVFNNLFATASLRLQIIDDESGLPALKPPAGNSFVVRDILTDFRRHDLGSQLHERNFDTSIQREFMTEPLWGVGSSPPYGHDGRAINLKEIILRHGGEAAPQRAAFLALNRTQQNWIFDFLNTLILFPPDDTASNLNAPGDINPANPNFPQRQHGNIKLPALFNDPTEGE